jgi:hypothetical protein
MALTAAQMTDVRRFAGYALAGTTQTITDEQDVVYLRFGMITMSLQRRLTTLSASEEAQTVTYLTTLTTLEAAIITAAGNLDTDQAAVWHRNRGEVTDRTSLFDGWRRRMCDFLGLPPGPGLSSGNRLVRC